MSFIINEFEKLARQLLRNRNEVNTAVLLIDSDLGFSFWLGKALDQAGYKAFPARNEADADVLLAEIPIDLRVLILGDAPAGVEDLAARWRKRCGNLRIVHLLEAGAESGALPRGIDAELSKPSSRDEQELLELLLALDRCMARPRELPVRSRV